MANQNSEIEAKPGIYSWVVAPSEMESRNGFNADSLLEEGRLSRREFLKSASASFGALGLADLLPAPDQKRGVGFWNSVFSIYKLNIDPQTIKINTIINEKWQKQTVLSFLSRKDDLSSTDSLRSNPAAEASRISITFTAHDSQHDQQNIKTAAHLGAFVNTATRLGYAVEAFKTGGTAAAV